MNTHGFFRKNHRNNGEFIVSLFTTTKDLLILCFPPAHPIKPKLYEATSARPRHQNRVPPAKQIEEENSTLTFFRYQRLEQHHSSIITSPRMHLPITVPSLLRQFIPGLRFRQQLRNRPLRQTQDVFGEESLANVVDGEKFTDTSGYVESVEILGGVFVHVVAEHLLEFGFHGVTFGDEAFAKAADHGAGCHAQIFCESGSDREKRLKRTLLQNIKKPSR